MVELKLHPIDQQWRTALLSYFCVKIRVTKWASQPSETVGCSEQSLGLWEVPQLAGGKGHNFGCGQQFHLAFAQEGHSSKIRVCSLISHTNKGNSNVPEQWSGPTSGRNLKAKGRGDPGFFGDKSHIFIPPWALSSMLCIWQFIPERLLKGSSNKSIRNRY